MSDVTIELAGPERRATLDNLFQLYVHDFSDFLLRPFDLQEDGRFSTEARLSAYWPAPDCDILFIRANGVLAGFAVVNRRSYSGEPCDFSMAEFFVARKFRRAGIGKAAALTVIGARVGQWEIDVVSRNRPAQSFWRSVTAAVAGAQFTELSRLDEGGNGLILRFRV